MTGQRKVFVIAEVGVNHNGSLELAESLVKAAKSAGADAVKFQCFKAEQLVTSATPKAGYQVRATGGEGGQLEMLRSLQLQNEQFKTLDKRCAVEGIEFLSTAFDLESLDFVTRDLKPKRLKIGSGDATNGPLLHQAARSGLPLILSTGMCSLADVEGALGILALGYIDPQAVPRRAACEAAFLSTVGQETLTRYVSLLHCTTEYPASFADANILAIPTLRRAFGLPVGFSDHTPGIAAATAAVAIGAAVVEKHITINKQLPGPDHAASLEPREFAAMVKAIREVEECMGSGKKLPSAAEIQNRTAARRSLVAAVPIRAGERYSTSNLAIKRPGTGLSAMHFWDVLGHAAVRDFEQDECIAF